MPSSKQITEALNRRASEMRLGYALHPDKADLLEHASAEIDRLRHKLDLELDAYAKDHDMAELRAAIERLREQFLEIANRAANMGDDDAADWLPSIYKIACEAAGENPWPRLRQHGFTPETLTVGFVDEQSQKTEG